MPSQRHVCASNYNVRDNRDAWRHGKSGSTPSLTKVFRRRTSRLNFFAKITSAPMSFHFCADGVSVGTVWIPAAQSKLQSSAGACIDGNRTALIVEIHGKQDREPTSIFANAKGQRLALPLAPPTRAARSTLGSAWSYRPRIEDASHAQQQTLTHPAVINRAARPRSGHGGMAYGEPELHGRITLSPAEREAAKASGVDEATYAREKLKMLKVKKSGVIKD